MRFIPIPAFINIHLQRHPQRVNPFHLFPDHGYYTIQLFLRHLKNKLIMNLKEHPGSETILA